MEPPGMGLDNVANRFEPRPKLVRKRRADPLIETKSGGGIPPHRGVE